MPLSIHEVQTRAKAVRLLMLDVDGVLTDGSVELDTHGKESKRFYIRDGAAIVWARHQGLEVAWLSGRSSEVTTRRAHELGVRIVVQEGPDKRAGYDWILATAGVTDDQVAYMGDDLQDLPLLQRAGLSAAPADAAELVRVQVHWVSVFEGGRGAVRELIELMLRATDRWDPVIQMFQAR